MPPKTTPTISEIDSLEAYNRRKEDTLVLSINTLEHQVGVLEEGLRGLNTLVTTLLEQQAQANEEKAVQLALEQERLKKEKEYRDFLSKVGAATLTLLGIVLGSWLSYIIPAYMGKH